MSEDWTYKKGQEFLVYVKEGDECKRVAYSKECSVELKTSFVEYSSPTTGAYKCQLPQKTEWAVSVSGLVADTRNDETLFGLIGKEVELFYADRTVLQDEDTASESDAGLWHGTAYLESLQFNGTLHQTATYTAKFQGSGALTLNE
ncbi:MAG: phage tail protein [Prevotellaceae bacterium]|nr:phage tail protein [Prevotellaceae bacterium]